MVISYRTVRRWFHERNEAFWGDGHLQETESYTPVMTTLIKRKLERKFQNQKDLSKNTRRVNSTVEDVRRCEVQL